jgi:hypothetical protein
MVRRVKCSGASDPVARDYKKGYYVSHKWSGGEQNGIGNNLVYRIKINFTYEYSRYWAIILDLKIN